jgi:hypothetical protein
MARFILFLSILLPVFASATMPDEEIADFQRQLANKPVGERIAFWAERFIGTPYDPDPIGEYVREEVIVADERVDCMYLTFRVVELSLGKTPAEALLVALDKRFMHRGKMEAGKVVNYDDRFRYGEDMLESGKWGREITADFGKPDIIEGAGERRAATLLASGRALENIGLFRSGDIIFFINPPGKMETGGIVGHIGIIKKEGDDVYLVHANGVKNKGGKVKKILFRDYLETMPFIGVRVSRFETDRGISK